MWLSFQVFDATNTTRERRDMILNFAEENSFKVGCWRERDEWRWAFRRDMWICLTLVNEDRVGCLDSLVLGHTPSP